MESSFNFNGDDDDNRKLGSCRLHDPSMSKPKENEDGVVQNNCLEVEVFCYRVTIMEKASCEETAMEVFRSTLEGNCHGEHHGNKGFLLMDMLYARGP